ncbi:MAG: membrane protein insertion efficiency factor YidD [Patescibacteria group bacterium]|nr:membrane protein insertion efficiency factor YidD [Patescibacteria group bacterium]
MKKFIIWLLKKYQKYLSFDTGVPKKLIPALHICRFIPTCSQYTIEAVEKYGTVKGLYLGFKRIIRCNPFNKGGFDPLKQ